MRQSWISVRCRFHQSTTAQFSKMISRSTVTQFSVTICGSAFVECVSHFHVLAMNLFLRSICCVGRAVDSTRELSLKFQLWFQGLQWLCFHWRFLFRRDVVSLAIPSVNDDSTSLLISCVNRELVFVFDSISQPRLNFQRWFPVLQWLIFGDDFLISIRRVCFTFPCVSHESIFAIDLLRRSCCWFHTWAVTQISVVISRPTTIVFSLTISV